MGGDALYTVLWSERVVRWPKLSDDRPAAQWLTEQLTAGGLPIGGDPAGGSVATTWFGLPATARVLDEDLADPWLDYLVYRVLVIEVDKATALARAKTAKEGRQFQWRAAMALRDLCDTLDPPLAFVRRDPVDDIATFVKDLWPALIRRGNAVELSTLDFPLWYVQNRFADEIPPVLGMKNLSRVLPSQRGVFMLTGQLIDDWMLGSIDDWMPIIDDTYYDP
ncbi:hypothetical protein [Virgisporangium aurantiacum]|uniref:Uncharacterized protein n=1 Tax=Virgisporangium aurantiacum TaxID=175570 RepID=A0A8J3ZKD0_9ACTN|nr:hypothetical protein [Virgisporangium aurantiacum]GIJ63096.1 hypothetical protein Vau01_106120 [Virgisporangium aurantiacum]